MTDSNQTQASAPSPQIGRNEPCPCGSGKKYKRCHGVDAPPILTESKKVLGMDPSMLPPGFDPNSIDPQWLSQFTSALQGLPKGQLQRMQQLMGKAMQGKDISQEAADFESGLPVELQNLVNSSAAMDLRGAVENNADGVNRSKETAPLSEEKKESLSKFSKFFGKFKKS